MPPGPKNGKNFGELGAEQAWGVRAWTIFWRRTKESKNSTIDGIGDFENKEGGPRGEPEEKTRTILFFWGAQDRSRERLLEGKPF